MLAGPVCTSTSSGPSARDTRQARYMSFFMMVTILLSILNFCLETLPDCEWVKPPIVPQYELLCAERLEGASPWYEVEYFCIVVFTIEFLLRLLASPEGERQRGGLLAFCRNSANIIDLVRCEHHDAPARSARD